MQPEDYMTEKDLIKEYVREIRYGFPSEIAYHAGQLERLLPKDLVKQIVNKRLDEIAGLDD